MEWVGNSATISGKLSGFSSGSSFAASSVSALSCASPQASLYKLDANGNRVEPAAATTTLAADGSYSFNVKSAGLELQKQIPVDPLIVVVSGCSSKIYLRPVTGAKDQDVTMGSSLLGYMLNTAQKEKLSSILRSSPADLSALLNTLAGASTLADAYNVLISNQNTQDKFTQLFGIAPTALVEASPEVVSSNIPSHAQELAPLALKVSTTHWSASYNSVYTWKLDNTVIGHSADLNWTPGANSQGSHVLSITIGEDDGSGNINSANPTKVLTQNLNIANNILPISPTFSVTNPSVVGTTPINSRSLTITISTGSGMANCASFSSLALTEEDTNPPAPSAFTILCNQAGTQDVSFNLASSGDGQKTLRMWARDADGTISVSPSTFAFNLDMAPPTATISTTPLALSNSSSQSFAFTGSDNGGTIDHFECLLDSGAWTACSSPISYSAFIEGDHTFSLKAIDTAGNASIIDSKTWHIDLTAPVLTLTGTPNTITNQLTSTFSFSAVDSGGATVSGFLCKLDGASYSSCTSPKIDILSAGTHNLLIKALDTAGNVSSPQSFSWTIDTISPTTTIGAKPASITNSQSPSFSFSATDSGGGAVASYECQMDGAGFSACSSPKNYASILQGSHTFQVRAIDTATNIGVAQSYTWTIDTTNPTVTISINPASLTNSTSASFSFSATDTGGGSVASYQCKLDSAAYGSCTSPHGYSSLSSGSHTFSVQALDTTGNTSLAATYTWDIDTTAPTLNITANPSSLTNATTANFSFSATDSGGGSVASYQCKLDSGTYSSCTSPQSYSSLTQGSHTFSVTAIDSVGNLNAATTYTWTIDTTPPTVTISSNPASLTNSTSASFSFSGTDTGGGAISSYECSLDGTSYSVCTSPQSYSSLASSSHNFQVRAIDTADNTGSAASSTWTIDTTTPLASINSGPASITNLTTANFTFSANPPPAGSIIGYDCNLDGAGWVSCSSPKSYSSFAQGSHTFQVRSIDNNSNLSTPTSQTWTVDLTAPSLSITANPSSVTASTTGSFSFSATDSGGGSVASYQCKIDSGSYASCSSPKSYSSLAAGNHTFYVTTTDTAGNTSAAQTYTWTIDLTGPATTIGANPNSITNATTANFSFSATDSGGGTVASYQCKLDSGSFAGCTNPQAYGSLAQGSHSFQVYAIDSVGNSGATQTYSWMADLTAPIATISANPSSITNSTSASFSFSATDTGGGSVASYSCKIDGGSYGSCTSPQNYSALTQGSHTFSVTATDTAGNTSTAATYTWTLDTTTPTLTINTNPTSLNNSTSASFAFSASDTGGGSVSTYSCKLDGGSYGGCSSPVNYSSLLQGSHTFYAMATDTAGNTTAASTYTWTIDLTAPTVTISANPNSITNSTSPSFSFSATDTGGGAVSGYQCSLDGAAYASCTSAKSYSGLSAGSHSFAVTATDTAGNTSSAATYNWTIDTAAPTITITANPVSLTNSTSTSFSFSATDTGGGSIASYSCKLDGGSYSSCTSPQSYSSLAQGSHTFYVTSTDTAGNTSTAATYSWTIDTTVPTITITTPSTNGTVVLTSQLTSYSIGGACSENGIAVTLSGAASSSVVCSSGAWSTNIDISGLSDGTLSLTASLTDAAGNSASSSARTFIKDTTAPVINITTPTAMQGNTSTGNVTWSLTEANVASSTSFTVEIYDGSTWSTAGTKAASAGANSNQSYNLANFAVPNVDVTTAKIRVTITDAAGNQTQSMSGVFLIDSSLPTVTAFGLNNGTSPINTNTIPVSLTASDNISKLTHFCLKYTTGISAPTAPASGDTCWTAVNAPSPGVSPALNINFSNHYFAVGLSNGTYKVYGWVKNEAGLISTLSNSGSGTIGTDYASIDYTPGNPPVVVNVIAVNSDTHGTPPSTSEMSAPSGQPLYIKWKATDDDAFPSNNIKIYYTTDETNFTLLADNVSNQANSGCTVDGTNYNGCYVATSPSSAYFKIRITVTDSSQKTTFASAVPNNLGSFKILAGNTETGIGGSANSAVMSISSGGTTTGLPGALVISDNGTFFIRDSLKGVLKIDPSNGLLQSFIPYTGVLTNGAIGTATLRNAGAYMSLDYSNNLLIFDYDRIRKVNLTTNTVSTFIGGGATRASGISATSFQFNVCTSSSTCILIPLPNGDIYFIDKGGSEKLLWHYQASDQKVYSISLAGTGLSSGRPASDDVSTTAYLFQTFSLEFDVTTSAITTMLGQFHPNPCPSCGSNGYLAFFNASTGNTISSPVPATSQTVNFKPIVTARNGKIYNLSVESTRKLMKYNSQANTWSTVLGTGTTGYCADGTDALSCNVNIMDAFVTADERIFFTDNGLIRTIDSSNKVQTLFGQRKSFGNGGLATSSRINNGSSFDFMSSGDIVFMDGLENVIRKFTPGGNISLVAGTGTSTYGTNGAVAATTPIAGSWWGGRLHVVVDPATDDIYFSQNTVMKVKNSDQKIYLVIGGGGTSYATGDGLVGSAIGLGGSELSELLGIHNNKLLLTSSTRISGSNYKCYVKEYDINDSYRQSHIAGNDNLCNNTNPTDGVATSTADVGNVNSNLHPAATWFADVSGWIIGRNSTSSLKAYTPGGTISAVNPSALPYNYVSFTLVKNASNQNVIYYCATNGRVYKYNVTTSTNTALTWPTSTYSCAGFTMKYSASRGSVIFPMSQNGLTAFAEIVDTP